MRRFLAAPFWAVLALGLLAYLVVGAREKHHGEPEPKVIDTHIGKLTFQSGYPSRDTVNKLYDEIDFQRACQAYLWAIPAVSIYEWRHAHEDTFRVRNGQWVLMTTYDEKFGILTPNNTTPYLVATVDLARTGPFVVELPRGKIIGTVIDVWQRYLEALGGSDLEKGDGMKYLILPPNFPPNLLPKEGYRVIQAQTNFVFFGLRLLDENENEAIEKLVPRIRSYSYSQRDNPPKEQAVRPNGKKWSQVPPQGLKFWERVAEIIENEPVQERDRLIISKLRKLGIEKGKPFAPDARQKKLLEEAAIVGDAMARANSFDKRIEPAYWEGTHWKDALVVTEDQKAGDYDLFDERAAWFFEAVTVSKSMRSRTAGWGMRYLASYQDKNGDWLTGGRSYHLKVPANPPASQFWSVTAYDQANRQFVLNPQKSPDVSSRNPKLVKNADGTFDIYLGPTPPPKGLEANWIQTNPGEGYFIYFRLFGPGQPFLDKVWALPDIEPKK